MKVLAELVAQYYASSNPVTRSVLRLIIEKRMLEVTV